jgi:hypothetical protein
MHGHRPLGHALVCLVAVLLLGLAAAGQGQDQVSVPAPSPEGIGNSGASLERVMGAVTATNPAAKQIELKTDAGGKVTVVLQDKTTYLRVPPGETDLKNAVKITPTDIGVGDRVYARGRLSEDRKSIPALAVIVMTKADLAKTRERERADWQKRGVAGTLSGLNEEKKEITLAVRSKEGTKTLIVELAPKATVRRYAPDSVRLGEAKPSSFAELKIGDSLRILGDKNSDGTRIKPEEIVAGSFRNIAGIVSAIDAAAGEIRMTDLQSRRSLSVQITADTMLRRMPAPATKGAATAKAGGGNPAPAGRSSEGPARGGAPPAAATNPPQGASGGAASGGRAGGASTQNATGGGGLSEPERMPVLSLRDLKQEEAIIVLCTVGADPSRITAIVVVAGVEPLLGPALQDQAQVVGPWNFFDISVP